MRTHHYTRMHVNLVGHRFGRLEVVSFVGRADGNRWWECRCVCGNVVRMRTCAVTRAQRKSCGCLHADVMRAKGTHGLSRTPEYEAWRNMIERCENPNLPRYAAWGGRGIKVCERWQDVHAFLADMGYRPSPEHSIDRIDNDGDYRPENCRWATMREQSDNTRRAHLVEHNGVTRCLNEWARLTGIAHQTLCHRYQMGDRGESLFRPPKITGRPYGAKDKSTRKRTCSETR